jgi:hypothetical protein
MLTANPKKAALTKILVGAVVVIGCVAGAAPAGADPAPSNTHPDPFAGITCSCGPAVPTPGQGQSGQFNRGIWDGSHGVAPAPGTR